MNSLALYLIDVTSLVYIHHLASLALHLLYAKHTKRRFLCYESPCSIKNRVECFTIFRKFIKILPLLFSGIIIMYGN